MARRDTELGTTRQCPLCGLAAPDTWSLCRVCGTDLLAIGPVLAATDDGTELDPFGPLGREETERAGSPPDPDREMDREISSRSLPDPRVAAASDQPGEVPGERLDPAPWAAALTRRRGPAAAALEADADGWVTRTGPPAAPVEPPEPCADAVGPAERVDPCREPAVAPVEVAQGTAELADWRAEPAGESVEPTAPSTLPTVLPAQPSAGPRVLVYKDALVFLPAGEPGESQTPSDPQTAPSAHPGSRIVTAGGVKSATLARHGRRAELRFILVDGDETRIRWHRGADARTEAEAALRPVLGRKLHTGRRRPGAAAEARVGAAAS